MNNEGDKLLTSAYDSIGLDLSKIILFIVSFFYGTGYLIQAITLRNYGINRLEAIKLQYIEVGATFSVLLLLVTVIPVAIVLAHFRIRKKSSLPNYRIGALGYSMNTIGLISLVICAALFITNNEWLTTIKMTFLGRPTTVQTSHFFVTYVIIASFVLVGLPLVERTIVKNVHNTRPIYMFFIEPLRFAAVLLGLFLVFQLTLAFTWIGSLAIRGLTFI
ncbi:MAG: hypothetical protein AB2810_17915, partial [Candidatus Thiodiazotropha endolucinida]